MTTKTQIPTKISIHRRSKRVTIQYRTDPDLNKESESSIYELSAEYLRVFSPSAEVQRHGNPELQFGKKGVGIEEATLIGLYGVKFQFDDGHNTGIYTWPYLVTLCKERDKRWETYISELHQAGKTREKDSSVVKFFK